MKHIRKGCLARPREDVPSDGSRIESSHKGWRGIQRANPGGLVMFCALAHDFVLRRNIRVGCTGRYRNPSEFLLSTHGSHHTHLINHIAKLWNSLVSKQQKKNRGSELTCLPELPDVNSGESFGLVSSAHATTFGGLFEVKEEEREDGLYTMPKDDDDVLEDLLHELNIDPSLLSMPATKPEPTSVATTSGSSGSEPQALASHGTPIQVNITVSLHLFSFGVAKTN
jgi:hypothetical protein